MKKCISYIAAILFLCTSMAYAVPMIDITITDDYIGGNYGDSWDQNDGDVIASSRDIDSFDIDWMNVIINSDGDIEVTIQTDYLEGYLGTNYGDLFISTDGWDPVGTSGSGYTTDTYEYGEDWEFVLDTSHYNIYAVNEGNIDLSNDVMTVGSSQYRTNQEVLYAPERGESALESFSFTPGGFINDTDTPRFISYDFNLSALGIDWEEDGLDLGFHWAMTCANDVIEGGVSMAPVPEPGTMLLLGVGLLGLGAVGRKHYPQK